MAEKILIVDDDLDTLRLVGLLLQRKGYEIIAADRGNQGLEKAISELPDLILLDVMMPDMDGFEVLRQIRNNEKTADIPVIMFTAKTQVDDKVTGFEAGADDYLTKPTHPSELTARVKAILARAAGRHVMETDKAKGQRGAIIGVLAAKGGLGVTTVATNLAFMLANQGASEIILADLRPGNGSLSLSLGYKNQSAFSNLLRKDALQISAADVRSSLLKFEQGVNLLLSSYTPSEAQLITATEQFVTIVRHLAYMGDYIVLDMGDALPGTTQKMIELCDQLLVITEPDENTVIHTKALLDELSLQILGLGRISIVLLTRIRLDAQLSSRAVQDRLGHPVAAVISPDPELAFNAGMQQIPMIALQKEGLIYQQYEKLANIFVKNALA